MRGVMRTNIRISKSYCNPKRLGVPSIIIPDSYPRGHQRSIFANLAIVLLNIERGPHEAVNPDRGPQTKSTTDTNVSPHFTFTHVFCCPAATNKTLSDKKQPKGFEDRQCGSLKGMSGINEGRSIDRKDTEDPSGLRRLLTRITFSSTKIYRGEKYQRQDVPKKQHLLGIPQ